MEGSRSSGASSSGGYSSGASTRGSSPARGSVGRSSQPYSSSGRESGSSVPSQTYAPNYQWNWNQWNNTNWYVYRLMSRYYFLDGYDYLWRYRQGDSPLTQHSMSIALQECASASAGMLRLSDQLENIVNQYETGQLSQAEFEGQVEQTTKQMRKLSKKIRKDDFLDYIDQRQKDYTGTFKEATSVRGLRALTQQLRMIAFEVDSGLQAFSKEDMARTVGVAELERPSFDSLTKGIERLSKTIERSARQF